MKRFRLVGYLAATMASTGFVLPLELLAADAGQAPVPAGSRPAVAAPAASGASQSPTISDVSLGEGGILTGQVLTGQGDPLPQSTVIVRGIGTEAVTTISDPQGRFAIRGLKGGTYEVVSGGGYGVFRLWTPNASPPSASKQVLIVAGGSIARGQNCCPPGQCCPPTCCPSSGCGPCGSNCYPSPCCGLRAWWNSSCYPCNSCGCGPCGGYWDPWHITNGQIVTGTAIAGLVAAVIAVSVSNHGSSRHRRPRRAVDFGKGAEATDQRIVESTARRGALQIPPFIATSRRRSGGVGIGLRRRPDRLQAARDRRASNRPAGRGHPTADEPRGRKRLARRPGRCGGPTCPDREPTEHLGQRAFFAPAKIKQSEPAESSDSISISPTIWLAAKSMAAEGGTIRTGWLVKGWQCPARPAAWPLEMIGCSGGKV